MPNGLLYNFNNDNSRVTCGSSVRIVSVIMLLSDDHTMSQFQIYLQPLCLKHCHAPHLQNKSFPISNSTVRIVYILSTSASRSLSSMLLCELELFIQIDHVFTAYSSLDQLCSMQVLNHRVLSQRLRIEACLPIA